VSRRERAGSRPRKACCMVSEILEEAGIDREHVRRVRRQVLEGVILLCRWQLQRMEEERPAASRARPRRVQVE